MNLALVDYGAGNLQSVRNALLAAGAGDLSVTSDPDFVAKADRIVLPGVGAFAHCMNSLSSIDGMVDALNQAVRQRGMPFLGICVGMQLMADVGEEHGAHQGLGWISGRVARLQAADPDTKIPHMGWNDVLARQSHDVLSDDGEAYYLHSYHFVLDDPLDALALTKHGEQIIAGVARDNFVGVQFHPEKSQRFGLDLLSRFLEWNP